MISQSLVITSQRPKCTNLAPAGTDGLIWRISIGVFKFIIYTFCSCILPFWPVGLIAAFCSHFNAPRFVQFRLPLKTLLTQPWNFVKKNLKFSRCVSERFLGQPVHWLDSLVLGVLRFVWLVCLNLYFELSNQVQPVSKFKPSTQNLKISQSFQLWYTTTELYTNKMVNQYFSATVLYFAY